MAHSTGSSGISSQPINSDHSDLQEQTKLPSTENTNGEHNKEDISADTVQIRNCIVTSRPIEARSITDTHPLPLIQTDDSAIHNENYFFALVCGVLSQQLSANAAFRAFSYSDAFIGAGYALSDHSSLRIIVAEEVFALPATVNTISFHDTAFVHEGQSYDNLIGEVHTTSSAAQTRVYSIGISYRYILGAYDANIRPFGELFAGGSTTGLLTRGEIGIEMAASSNLHLDVQAMMSELLTQRSSWLLKSSFAASISYRW